jgi:hypothetical protein
MPESSQRRGLDPVPPARVPRLPGRGAPPEPPAGAIEPALAAPAILDGVRNERGGTAPSASARTLRPREFQLDKVERDWVDTTALAIRLRTETNFDRSALVRGILKAVRESGINIGDRCATEQEVYACMLQVLAQGAA